MIGNELLNWEGSNASGQEETLKSLQLKSPVTWKMRKHSSFYSLFWNASWWICLEKCFIKFMIVFQHREWIFWFLGVSKFNRVICFLFLFQDTIPQQFFLALSSKSVQNTKILIILTILLMVQIFTVFGLNCGNSFPGDLPALSLFPHPSSTTAPSQHSSVKWIMWLFYSKSSSGFLSHWE